LTTALLTAVFSSLPSCSSQDETPERIYISGTVTYNGEPISIGAITFIPLDEQKARQAGGGIINGKFTLTTVKPADGAVPGKYIVTVASHNASPSEDAAKANPRSEVPSKYGNMVESPLRAEVTPSEWLSFAFALKD
jgi:hypothetical protein